MNLYIVHALSAGEDSDGDGAELLAGSEEEPALDGPAGDLDQRSSFWDEPDASGHVGEPWVKKDARLGARRRTPRNCLVELSLGSFFGKCCLQ